uniref:Uncharacterized protein n=1 Tax=Romanomermis culicivorax TaxID=13658 RepID=A0A915KM65_ROMCU
MNRAGADAEKDKVFRIFNDHMTSYLESIKPQIIGIKSIEPFFGRTLPIIFFKQFAVY